MQYQENLNAAEYIHGSSESGSQVETDAHCSTKLWPQRARDHIVRTTSWNRCTLVTYTALFYALYMTMLNFLRVYVYLSFSLIHPPHTTRHKYAPLKDRSRTQLTGELYRALWLTAHKEHEDSHPLGVHKQTHTDTDRGHCILLTWHYSICSNCTHWNGSQHRLQTDINTDLNTYISPPELLTPWTKRTMTFSFLEHAENLLTPQTNISNDNISIYGTWSEEAN